VSWHPRQGGPTGDPEKLRDQIGLAAGVEVERTADGSGSRIEPVSGSALAEEGGFLVIPASGVRFGDDDVRHLRLADQRRPTA
jgi:hypothetical protein